MKITTFNVNEAIQDSYLITDKQNAIIIDPGFNGTELLNCIEAKDCSLQAVFLTHGHFDHIRDLRMVLDKVAVPVYIHESDKRHLSDDSLNYAKAFNHSFVLKKNTRVIPFHDQESFAFEGIRLKVHHTPGHTAGSCCFEIANALFTGDTLFKEGYGRTDLATGSSKAIRESIKKIFSTFSNDTTCYPGHEAKAKLSDIKKNLIF